jgi:predicted acyl esterase
VPGLLRFAKTLTRRVLISHLVDAHYAGNPRLPKPSQASTGGIDNGADRDPKVRIFVMGANKWRTANAWPIPGTEYRKYYLHSQGGANTVSGDGWLSTKKPENDGGGSGSPL